MIETPIQPVFSPDVFFLLVGAVLVLMLHAGLVLREAGLAQAAHQSDAFRNGLAGLAVASVAYFVAGHALAYGGHFFSGAATLGARSGHGLMKFGLLLTFAALVPAIVAGALAERARPSAQLLATALIVALVYPFFEGIVRGERYHVQALIESGFGAPFHDFGGSVVVHAMGGWIALGAVLLLGPRTGRYGGDGSPVPLAPASIAFVALGTWLAIFGSLGFNLVTVEGLDRVSGVVAVNSLMALAGGVLAGLAIGRREPLLVQHGALSGLVAIAAGADVMHPLGALATGAIGALLFALALALGQYRWRIDDAVGAWPLHGVGGAWGGIACGLFGSAALGGAGGVSVAAQLVGTLGGIAIALAGGLAVFGVLKVTIGLRAAAPGEPAPPPSGP